MANCSDCSDNKECSGVSGIEWDAAVSSCLSQLGAAEGMSLSLVINQIAAAVCGLVNDDSAVECTEVSITGSYPNIEFVGTSETTLCDLITAIDTRFSNILNQEFSDCFGVATTIGEKVSQMTSMLCEDLYTAGYELFLPIAGNGTSNPQQSYYMGTAQAIFWKDSSGATILGFGSDASFGLLMSGGINPSGHLNPIALQSPVKTYNATRNVFSVLASSSNTLTEDALLGNYIIDKSTVNSVNLPQLSGMNVSNPVVTFTASSFGLTVLNCKIYPYSGETIQGSTEYDFGRFADWITFIGDSGNWRIVAFGTF
jgi:hypothetical protein